MKASPERKAKECGRGRRKSGGKKEIRGKGGMSEIVTSVFKKSNPNLRRLSLIFIESF